MDTLTIGDLKAFCKRNARLSFLDYGDKESYRGDYNRIRSAQRQCKKFYAWYCESNPLINGEYYNGRLIIKDNKIEYITGQYTPTEVYWAFESYLNEVLK